MTEFEYRGQAVKIMTGPGRKAEETLHYFYVNGKCITRLTCKTFTPRQEAELLVDNMLRPSARL